MGGHIGLVEEDAAEMVSIGKHVRLAGKVGATRINQINAGKVVLLSDFLSPQMLLDSYRIVSSSFHCGVVSYNDTLCPVEETRQGMIAMQQFRLMSSIKITQKLCRFQ